MLSNSGFKIRHATIAAVGMALLSSAAPAQEVLTGEQLSQIAEQVRSFKPRDEFDTPPAMPSLAGKRFSYTVAPLPTGADNKICNGSPRKSYCSNEGRLDVGASGGVMLPSDFVGQQSRAFPEPADRRTSRILDVYSFTCQFVRQPDYVANNAMGAQFTIKKTTTAITAIGDSPLSRNKPWKTYWEKPVTGDEARQLSEHIRIRISGTLSDWSPGKSLICGTHVRLPTIQLPQDETTSACLFKGRPDLFEVIDARNGAILFSSPRQPD